MGFKLRFTEQAKKDLESLSTDERKQRRVKKCLSFLESNPKHPGLRSHKYSVMKTLDGRDLWESYVENNTPAAWRVFWFYGPDDDVLTIVSITEHP